MHYHPMGSGRYVMRLDPGDEIITSLRQFAADEEVGGGYLTGLGSTSNATMSWLDPESGEYVKRKFDEPMEVATLSGTISVAADDGRPFIHLHAVLAPKELISYAGHIHEARTGAVMELVIFTFTERLERQALQDKPFPWLVLPGEDISEGGSGEGDAAQ